MARRISGDGCSMLSQASYRDASQGVKRSEHRALASVAGLASKSVMRHMPAIMLKLPKHMCCSAVSPELRHSKSLKLGQPS